MEIINSSTQKRTILVVQDSKHNLTQLKNILAKKYNVYFFESANSDFQYVRNLAVNISCAVICATDASANNYALFDWIKLDSMVKAVPILIYCNTDYDYSLLQKCIELGAVDTISEPLYESEVTNRIENSIRLKDSATFYEIERMLKELPSNIYLKDDNCRYIFATHYWHHLDHSDDPNWTIRGKTDIDIRKDRENAIKAMESDRELMRTGVGTNYIIEINADNVQEFLEVIKRPVRDEKGNITGIIALINDVTDKELMRISLEKKALYDELTGAGNRTGFEKFLPCVKDQTMPVSIISADCNNLKYINDTFGHIPGDDYIRMSVLIFRMILPSESKIFRTGGDEFVMFVPDTDTDTAENYIQQMKAEEKHFKIKDTFVSVAYGTACICNGSEDINEVLDKADKNMYSDKKKSKCRRI